MAAELQAAIFDVDGTLLDTWEYIMRAFEGTLAFHGHEVPDREVIARYIGRPLVECYAGLAPGAPYQPLAETHGGLQSGMFELITSYEGVGTVLQALRDRWLRLGIYSSRYGNLVPSLVHTGIAGFFDAVVDGKQVSRHKPDPEGILIALGQLDVSPENAVMVGDAPVDILAGKAARVRKTIALTHGFGKRADLELAGPDYFADDFAAVGAILLGPYPTE